jgi:hypothetical protein
VDVRVIPSGVVGVVVPVGSSSSAPASKAGERSAGGGSAPARTTAASGASVAGPRTQAPATIPAAEPVAAPAQGVATPVEQTAIPPEAIATPKSHSVASTPNGRRAKGVSGGAGGSLATGRLGRREARLSSPSAIGHAGDGTQVSQRPGRSTGTRDREPGGPTAPVPTGVGIGNGGEGATGAGVGGSPGAAAACSQTVLYVPSVTMALRTFALSRAPEPVLLLPERPG